MTINHFFIQRFLKMKKFSTENEKNRFTNMRLEISKNVKIKNRGAYQINQLSLKSQTSIGILSNEWKK